CCDDVSRECSGQEAKQASRNDSKTHSNQKSCRQRCDECDSTSTTSLADEVVRTLHREWMTRADLSRYFDCLLGRGSKQSTRRRVRHAHNRDVSTALVHVPPDSFGLRPRPRLRRRRLRRGLTGGSLRNSCGPSSSARVLVKSKSKSSRP